MKQFAFEEPRFLGERMRTLRLAHGAKQEDVAAILNVSRSTYSYYETGRTRPDPHVLGVLADFYQVPISCFFQEKLDTTKKEAGFDPASLGKLTDEENSLIRFLRTNSFFRTRDVLAKLEEEASERDNHFDIIHR